MEVHGSCDHFHLCRHHGAREYATGIHGSSHKILPPRRKVRRGSPLLPTIHKHQIERKTRKPDHNGATKLFFFSVMRPPGKRSGVGAIGMAPDVFATTNCRLSDLVSTKNVFVWTACWSDAWFFVRFRRQQLAVLGLYHSLHPCIRGFVLVPSCHVRGSRPRIVISLLCSCFPEDVPLCLETSPSQKTL